VASSECGPYLGNVATHDLVILGVDDAAPMVASDVVPCVTAIKDKMILARAAIRP